MRWRWLEEKIRRLEERMALPGVMVEWPGRIEQIEKWKEQVKEVSKRIYHALQAHDVVEFLRRISPRVDAFFSQIEAKLAERYPTLYKVYALYKGPYVAHYLLAEPVIRRWEAEGKITRAEADQLRRARQLLWAAAAEAKARAAQAEKGVDAKHLRDVFEHREEVVRRALEQLDLMRQAKTKEELAERLGYAAAYLQHIDPGGTSRLWTALGIAAEGRPVDFSTTREVVEFLWERRERLDVIVQRAKELIAQHYAHAPLSIKDIAKEEVSRQVAKVKPLLEAAAKARRYAATGEGVEEAVRALKSKEAKKAAKAAEVEIGALRKAADRAYKLEEERKELTSKIEELRKRAEAIRAELETLRHSGPSKELEERQRRLEEVYVEIEKLQQRLSRVEERLVEARRVLAVEAREVLEQAARSYRGVFEGVKHEVDPVYLELRRALVEGRLDVAYKELRERYEKEGRDVRHVDRVYQQLKPFEERLQSAREELRAAVERLGPVVVDEAYVRAGAVSELKQLFEKLPTAAEGDVRRGVELAKELGLEKTAQFLEEYLRQGQVRERYARAASEAAETLRGLARTSEFVAKEHQAAEEKLRRVSMAEDALRRIGQSTEFGQAAKAAKEAGLEKTAQFLERWAGLVRQAEERGGLEVVNRLGRALASGRLAEEASIMTAEGKALGEWFGRVAELRPLYEEAVKEAAKAKAEAEAVVKTAAELRTLIEKTRAESPADLVRKLSKIDVKELESAVKAARSAGLEAAAKYFEELANFAKTAEEKAKAFREYSKVEKRLRSLEAKARVELYNAQKAAEGLVALLQGREYERLAHVREALKALDEEAREALKKPLERLAEARREVELLRHSYTYEVGAPVWRELKQRGVDTLLLRAPLTAYITATLEASLLREAAEVFRPAFAKYEREAATTVVYLPVSEGDKLGPAVSIERALKGEIRPYAEEIADVKAPTLKQAVKEYYAGRGRQFKELAYLEARAAEAVLDVHAARQFLERYAKESKQEDLALAIALAYRAAKAYQQYQHESLGGLADVVAEVRRVLNLTGRDVTTEALAKAVEQLGGEKALRESLRPKNVEEAVKWLREAWAAVDYRVLESKLGLTRTYTIPEAERALEYTAKALTPSRIAALTEGKVAEEAFSVMRAYSLLREFEKFMRERPREPLAKAEPTVLRALDKPLPSLQSSAVDKVAKEAAAKLIREAEALAQRHGLRHAETLAVLEQIKELVKVSPEAFGELVNAASAARGPFKEWARQTVAEVKRQWDVYKEGWEAPVVQRLELLKKVPAAMEAPTPVPREFVALALWAELNQVRELRQLVKEVSPAAVEEALLIAEAVRAVQRDLDKLKSVDIERPIYLSFETLEKKTVRGVEKLVVDEAAELSKASRYLQHQDPRVREEAELLLKFARGEITRTQLREELSKRGGPLTEEGKEAVSMEQRLKDLEALLKAKLAKETGVLWHVEAMRGEFSRIAYRAAVRAGLGDSEAEAELRVLAALSPYASTAVKYAESLKLLRALTEGLDRVVYEPELAKKFPELRDVLLERDRALRRAEELERSGDPEKLIVAGVLREFAEGRVTRTQLLDVAREKGVDLSEFSERRIAEARGMVMERVKEMAAELAAYRDAPKSLREALEARMPMDLYAELANELRVKLEEAAAKAGIPAEYAKYGVLQGAAKYVEELTKLVTQLPVDVQAAYAALGAVRHELMAVDELKLLAELANGNFSTVERLRKKIEEAEAEVAKAVFNTIRELGVRRVPYELLEVAARVEFTPGELRMLLAELDAAKAAERDKAFAWPEFAEYVPVIFVTSDEKAAKTWRRGGGLVIEALVFVGDKPKRVYILAPRNAPVEEIREALYAIKGVEIVGTPKWLAGWDVAEALGFAVENTEKGVALKPRVEAFIDLDKPLPYRREVWEALKLTRPDLLGEAVGARWSLVHWEDGLAAVNAYLFLRKLARWDAFEPADIERVLEEYRRRYNPTFERYVKAMSVERLGFDVVDFLKGAYAVSKRLRGEAAAYKPSDAEAYARLIWWAKKVGRHASLYELLQPEFRLPETLKALNIAIKGGWITYSEALDLFNSWRRNNDVAKWDEEALKIALRGNLRMKETEEAIKRFVDSIKTSKQLEAEEAARERLKLMEEQKKREEEMKKIRGIKERPRAKPAETQQEAKREEVEQVKKEEAQPKAEETRQVKREEAQPEETKAARAEAERPAEEKPSEEVSYVKFGYVHVKSTHVDNAVVKAFAVEHPSNWHHKLTPEAYIELRAGLAPFELEKLEAARERAADRVKALLLLSQRFGSVEVPDKVRKKAERKAAAEFEKWVARLASRHDPEVVEAVVNRLKALVAKWVEKASVPNAYDLIAVAMWTWEGDPKTRTVDEEWGYWLFREDFKVVKELADRYGIEVLKLWNAYRSAVDKYLQVVTSYGDVVKKAVVPIDVALRTTLVAAGGIALAEALHGVVRPELVYAATAAASLALAGRYREAVQRIKTAVDNVKTAVEKAFQGVKIAVERLYEAVVEAAARILQMLREHWRAVALVAAAAAAGLITWVVAQQLDFTLWQDQAASLASAGFFPVVWPEDEDKQRQLWKKTLEDWSLSAAGEKVEVIRAVLSDKPVTAERFEQTESSAAREARLRAWLVKKALDMRWEPTAERAVATLVEEAVGPYLDKERLKAFGVRDGVVGFLYKLRGEKESALSVGNVEARELYAIVAKTREKTIRVEVLAREVKGGEFEAVDTPIGRLYRLASISVSARDNEPSTPKLHFTASVEREYRVGIALAGEQSEERKRAGLFGFILSDLGLKGLGSPDASEHAFLGLFAQIKRMYIDDASFTDTGLSLQIRSEVEERFPPKVFFWEAMKMAVDKALEKALGPQRPKDLNQVLEALCGGPCVDERGRPSAEPLLKVFREYFAELKELTAVPRTKEWRFYVRDDIDELRINERRGVAYVPRRMLFELLESMKWPEFWVALIEGDGEPNARQRQLGLSVGEKYIAAAAVLMAVLALRYGIQPRLIEGERDVYLNAEISRVVSLLLLHELRQSPVAVLEEDEVAKKAAQWGLAGVSALIARRWIDWGMPGGRDPPKLISYLALYEKSLADLYKQYQKYLRGEGEKPPYLDLVEGILREEGRTPFYVREGILPTTAFDLRMKYLDVEFKLDVEKAWERYRPAMELVDRSYVLSAELGEEKASATLMVPVETVSGVRWQEVKVWTDWHNYLVSCSGPYCDKAREALGAEKSGRTYYLDAVLAKAVVYTAVRRLEHSLEIGQWPLGVKKWMNAPARIELLEVRENGDVTIRIWFYKWLETRPHQPFVDVEIKYAGYKAGFQGWLYANEAEGIYREHLAELYGLFKGEGLEVTPMWDEKENRREVRGLVFYGGFRKALLTRIGYVPEPVSAEPATVKHLGGMRFEVDGREVAFAESKEPGEPLKEVLPFVTAEEAEKFYRRLKAAGVYAEVRGREVRLNEESYWGMVIASGATPEGWQLVYPLEGDEYRDLHVYKRVVRQGDNVRVYYQFVVKVGGVWRATGGWFEEKFVTLQHKDIAVLEALREAAKSAVGAELGEIGKVREGLYRLRAYRPVLEKFEMRVPVTKSSEVPALDLEGDFIVVKHGGVEHRVKFKLVKGNESIFVPDPSLHHALEELGVPHLWTPEGVKLYKDGMWGLLAAAVEEALNRKEQSKVEEVLKQLKLPSGVSIIKARPKRGHYIIRVEAEDGEYAYSVLKVDDKWTAMGGKVDKNGIVIMYHAEEKVAKAHAEAINELLAKCIEEGRCRKKEVRQRSHKRIWYFQLNKAELEETAKEENV
ncbi:MAG: hypothetical protein QW452_10355 [Pyrobaculum sp.]